MSKPSACLVAEAIGTFALTFIGAGAILTDSLPDVTVGLVGIAFAHGLILAIVVSATMNISGGHINPAVTITMLATGRIKPPLAIGYIIAQLVGASVAGFLLMFIFKSMGETGAEAIIACKLGTPNLNAAISPWMGVLIEIILTFLLVFAIFGTAVDPRAPKIGGFGIGLAVCVDILMGGPLTGAAMNPARTFGTLLGGLGDTSDLWSQHWVYWLGPIIGALLAAFVYDKFLMEHPEK
ncbi:MAG: aquaporin [Planctomycetota bacterium]|nr:aquaporin [Planctomycetota bacterium]